MIKLNNKIVLLIFSAVAFLIFFSSINSSFHFDDYYHIVQNEDVHIKSLTPGSLTKAAFSNPNNTRATSLFSFGVNYYISGLDTTSYHVVNILIHIMNAFLIYIIILWLFDIDSADDEKKHRLMISAFFTALFWLTTPANSQAVIYIVQRMTLLMTFFFLLGFLSYVSGRKSNNKKCFVLCALFFVLSVMSKENGITLIPVIILYEIVFIKKGDLKNIQNKEKLIFVALLIIFIAPALILKERVLEEFAKGAGKYTFTSISMYERILTQFRIFAFYLSQLILPLPGRFSITYQVAKSTSLFSPITTLFSFIIIAALFVGSILRLKRSPYLSFAILFFFITLSVEAIIPIELTYDHRMYLPCIFLFGAFTHFVVNRFYDTNGKAVIAAFIIIAITFSILTTIRGRVWENEITLWGDVVSKFPEDIFARYNLGRAFVADMKYSEAERELSVTVAKWENIAFGDTTKKTVRIPDRIPDAYNNLGKAQMNLKKYAEAEKNILQAIEYNDKNTLAHNNLGKLYYIKKDYKRAVDAFNKAIENDPDNIASYGNIASVYITLKDYDNAMRYFDMILKREPDNVPANIGVGMTYMAKGDSVKALVYFNKALRFDHGNMIVKDLIKKAGVITNK